MPEQTVRVRDTLLAFLSPWAFTKKPVAGAVVYGPKGTCKTSGCLAVLDVWAGHDLHAEFQDFSELMIRCRAAWRPNAPDSLEKILLFQMMQPRILLLDDVGKRATPEDQEYSGIIIKGRHDRGLVTILTGNQDLDTDKGMADFLSACDDRGADRFANCFVGVTGPNIRRAL